MSKITNSSVGHLDLEVVVALDDDIIVGVSAKDNDLLRIRWGIETLKPSQEWKTDLQVTEGQAREEAEGDKSISRQSDFRGAETQYSSLRGDRKRAVSPASAGKRRFKRRRIVIDSDDEEEMPETSEDESIPNCQWEWETAPSNIGTNLRATLLFILTMQNERLEGQQSRTNSTQPSRANTTGTVTPT
ncbi:hypothetical protein F5Y13DRAFT_190405 [Hypoxylon sp. FL1857]|nr:hypothetical protein F5Y13DRAFT_190405 [Hypoxylon sp. FL1857]